MLLAAAGCGGSGGTTIAEPVEFDVGDNDHAVVAAFGESITAGVGSSDGAGYRGELQRLLAAGGRPGLRVVDEGLVGSTSAAGAARIGDVLRRQRPAALLVLYGPSDPALTELQPPLDSGAPSIVDNIRTIIEAARANRTLVVVSTLPPVCGGGRAHQRQRTANLNEQIRGLARGMGGHDLGIVLVDAWGDFLRAAPPDGCGLLDASGTFPTGAGYAALAGTFYGGLRYLAW
jgi:lysophospholipase L1-like esterase